MTGGLGRVGRLLLLLAGRRLLVCIAWLLLLLLQVLLMGLLVGSLHACRHRGAARTSHGWLPSRLLLLLEAGCAGP